ncbi:hypothetical protein [Lactiplantibacillus pentosus]|jgi:hypothetical protein|uniref:hypothetical protein n=1 Tax=Lactiplantibacillus pentosus TaxID=1589 RepID=UPI000D0212A4|nr:hypothetical protein [Lactiplantibacillus pentosus]MCT3286927.1 hypothetical protein [Lactiplantibacillus pentosus]PRO86108.1 hypothetical protein C6Y10_03885 [Lactiplantibacillus pentosus]
MLTPNEIRRRLRRDLFTIAEAYQIGFEDRLYTETEYEHLKQTLLQLRELNMAPQHVDQLLAING